MLVARRNPEDEGWPKDTERPRVANRSANDCPPDQGKVTGNHHWLDAGLG